MNFYVNWSDSQLDSGRFKNNSNLSTSSDGLRSEVYGPIDKFRGGAQLLSSSKCTSRVNEILDGFKIFDRNKTGLDGEEMEGTPSGGASTSDEFVFALPGKLLADKVDAQTLKQIAVEKISSPELREGLEKALNSLEQSVKVHPTDKEAVLKQVARMLTDDITGPAGHSPLTRNDMAKIAIQGLRELVDPSSISQGDRGTCAFAALEGQLLRREPEVVFKFVADIALTGHARTTDQKYISFSRNCLKANPESEALDTKDGEISHFSQLFQFGAAKVLSQHEHRKNKTYGVDNENNEGVIDLYTGRLHDQTVKRERGASLIDIAHVHSSLTGKPFDTDANMEFRVMLHTEGIKRTLESFKERGKFPVVVTTQAHAFLVTDYDPRSRIVFLDNSWTRQHDWLGNDALDYQLFRGLIKGDVTFNDLAGIKKIMTEANRPAKP